MNKIAFITLLFVSVVLQMNAQSVITIARADDCYSSEITFSVTVPQGTSTNVLDHISWDFGDGSAPVSAGSTSSWPTDGVYTYKHTYATRGSYAVRVTPYKTADSSTPDVTKIGATSVVVKRCELPVNHNISVTKY